MPVYQKEKTSPVIMLLVNQDHGKKNPRTDNLTSTHPAMTVHSPSSFQAGFHALRYSLTGRVPVPSAASLTLAWGGKKCFAAQGLRRKKEGQRSQRLFPKHLYAVMISEAWKQNPFLDTPKSPEISSLCASGGLRDVVRFNQDTTVSHFQDHIQEECCASL